MQADDNDRHRILSYLNQWGYARGALRSYQPLHEGMSGARVYRIALANGEALLKIATPGGGPVALARARREIAFYRELAGRVPLRVPHVLAMSDENDSAALLLALYHASPPPEQWSAADFLEAARQLGRFHAAFWGQPESFASHPWLAWYQRENVAAHVEQARTDWQALQGQPHLASLWTEPAIGWLQHLLDRTAEVQAVLRRLPLTLCHGDCITSNILRDAEGRFVWADWQEVRLARGPEDLAFFLQRAEFGGASPQRAAIITEYHRSLEAHAGQPIDRAAIDQVIDAADLWPRLLYWPAYLLHAPESAVSAMLQTMRTLAERLGLTSG